MNYQRPELRDRLASEYVLGTLHGQARARFEKLRRQDALLDAAVLAWENRLIPLAGSVSSLAPSPELLTRIETRLGFRGKPEKQGWFAWLLKPAVGWVAAGLFVGVATTRLVDTIIPAPKQRKWRNCQPAMSACFPTRRARPGCWSVRCGMGARSTSSSCSPSPRQPVNKPYSGVYRRTAVRRLRWAPYPKRRPGASRCQPRRKSCSLRLASSASPTNP